MGIMLATNFNVKANLPLDTRCIADTLTDRDAIESGVRHEGLLCYVKEEQTFYSLKGGIENANWAELPYADKLNSEITTLKEYVDSIISSAKALDYIGTIEGGETPLGTYTPDAEVGDTYIVSSPGYINGIIVERGDMLICRADISAATESTYTSCNESWNIIQANTDVLKGASSTTAGSQGLVPTPAIGDQNKYLKGDGSWSIISQSDVDGLVTILSGIGDKNNLLTDDTTTIVNAVNEINTLHETLEDSLKYYDDPNVVSTDASYFTFTANSDTTATISKKSNVTFDVTNLVIPHKCTINGSEYIVNSIDNNAFQNCTSLKSAVIPNTVNFIWSYAFGGCTSLASVVISDSVSYISDNAFNGCTSLISVVIPDSVNYVDTSAFSGCSSLKSIILSNSMSVISDYIFNKCSALKTIEIPNSITIISDYAFSGCTNLTIICEQGSYAEIYAKLNNINYKYDIVDPSALAGIGDLSTLTTSANDTLVNAVNEIDLADERIKYYGDPDIVPTDAGYFKFTANDDGTTATIAKNTDAFDVTDLVIPYKCTIDGKEYVVTNLSWGAFGQCTTLKSVIIPNSISIINSQVFYGCSSLKSVVIPDSVTSIGDSAFYGCSALASIVIPDGVVTISDYAFDGCELLKRVVIPNSVTSVGVAVFRNCTNLDSIILSNNMTTITASLFEGCVSLDSIVIPDTVTEIGDSAFYGCRALTSITIPSSVTYIYDYYAFNGCTNLTIICDQGSYVEEYAKRNSINYKYGIVDPDALTNIGDLSTLTTTANDTLVNAVNEVDLATERIKYYGDSDIVPTDVSYFVFTAKSDGETAYIGRNLDIDFDITDLVIPYKCTINDKEYIVTNIEGDAFSMCTSLTSVVIPNSITTIGMSAFDGCTSLSSVTILGSVTTIGFRSFCNSSLKSVVIPSSVTTIGDSAFDGCVNLTIICEQGSVAETYAKNNSINYKYDIVDPGKMVYKGTVSVGDPLTPFGMLTIEEPDLENGAVYIYETLNGQEAASLSRRNVSINGEAFTIDLVDTSIDRYGITKTTVVFVEDVSDAVMEAGMKICAVDGESKIDLPDNHSIGWAYEVATAGIYVGEVCEVGDLIVCIADGTTANDDDWKVLRTGNDYIITDGERTQYMSNTLDDGTVIFRIGVHSPIMSAASFIENGVALDDKYTLSNVLSESIEYYGKPVTLTDVSYFTFTANDDDTTATIARNSDVTFDVVDLAIPYKCTIGYREYVVTRIDTEAFSSCATLASVIMPNSVTEIGEAAFCGCPTLASVTIPNSVTYIGSEVFSNCKKITSIVIPNSVTTIESFAFQNCTSLTSVTIPSSVTTISEDAFDGCTNLTIICEQGSYAEEYAKTNSINYKYDIIDPDEIYSKMVYKGTVSMSDVPLGATSSNTNGYDYFTIRVGEPEDGGVLTYEIITAVEAFCLSDRKVNIGGSIYTIDVADTAMNKNGENETFIIFKEDTRNAIFEVGMKIYPADGEKVDLPDIHSIGWTYVAASAGVYAGKDCEAGDLIVCIADGTIANDDDWKVLDTGYDYVIKDDGTVLFHVGVEALTISARSFIEDKKALSDKYANKTEFNNSVTSINNNLGDLSQLTTTEKDTLVDSINEVDLSVERVKYYDDPDIVPTDSSYFTFTANEDGITASIVLADTVDKTTLTSIVIPYEYIGEDDVVYNVTTIGSFAFTECTSLTSVVIPNSVTSIGMVAFADCTSLTSVVIPNSVTAIGMLAFYDCTSLASVTIPNSVTYIGSEVFSNCKKITSIVIPNSVTTIESSAFQSCTSLKSVVIPNSITSIGTLAFQNCTSLTSVTIPSSVTTISEDAFDGCTSDLTIICEQDSYVEEYAKLNSINYRYNVVDPDTYTTYEEFADTTSTINTRLDDVKAFNGIIDKESTTADITLEDNTERVYSELSSLTITYDDTSLEYGFMSSVIFTSGATATVLTYPEAMLCSGEDCIDGVFVPVPNKRYEFIMKYDGIYMIGIVGGVSI